MAEGLLTPCGQAKGTPTFCSSSRLSSWILLFRSFSSFSSRWLIPFFSRAWKGQSHAC